MFEQLLVYRASGVAHLSCAKQKLLQLLSDGFCGAGLFNFCFSHFAIAPLVLIQVTD
jgi:hypothetical protein